MSGKTIKACAHVYFVILKEPSLALGTQLVLESVPSTREVSYRMTF